MLTSPTISKLNIKLLKHRLASPRLTHVPLNQWNPAVAKYIYISLEHTYILPEHTYILPEHTYILPEHTYILPEHTYISLEYTYILPERSYIVIGAF
jgi:hypothetical protein